MNRQVVSSQAEMSYYLTTYLIPSNSLNLLCSE
ncbi:hypothetical protein HMPREF1181_02904 [Bacteroides stercoris CC31F]|uniref:Uncharacterized protein n=1 Tax=Bacteroides stercoris CC31F TaxID=1073351 RepID=S3ZBH8_BACSE|nr:hypothetical protein HMPREF1181_02904 [Bacteroides stercoris CC31F]